VHAFEISTHLRLIGALSGQITRLDAAIEQQLASISGVAPACTACGLVGGGHAPGCARDGKPVPGLVDRLDEITGSAPATPRSSSPNSAPTPRCSPPPGTPPRGHG
jgi:hypothetical protein